MKKKITVIFRRPEKLSRVKETVRSLFGPDPEPAIIFLCPGCALRQACRDQDAGGDAGAGPQLTDQGGDCAPPGFHPADSGTIAQMIRESDIVVPL